VVLLGLGLNGDTEFNVLEEKTSLNNTAARLVWSRDGNENKTSNPVSERGENLGVRCFKCMV
jgi:hypothetical protein